MYNLYYTLLAVCIMNVCLCVPTLHPLYQCIMYASQSWNIDIIRLYYSLYY